MKPYKKIVLSAIGVFMMMSCTDDSQPDFSVEKPDSVKAVEYLNKYDALKAYVDRTANPDFKLGAGATVSDYNSKGVFYRLANANFDELTAGYAMKHGAIVQDDGSLNLLNVEKFLELTEAAGLTVYGHTLCWHANQNAEYLNGLIQPALEPSVITNTDFEIDASGWEGWGNNSTRGRSALGEGLDGGYCYYFTNPSETDAWAAQTAFDLAAPLKEGSEYRLSLYIKASSKGAITAEIQTNTDYSSNSFGAIEVTTEWKKIDMSVTPSTGTRNRFLFSHGKFEGTVYIDNITLRRVNPNGGPEKTEEEKKEVLTQELETWIAGMYSVTKDKVKTWDVVNEPMSDWPDPYELKTGIGKELTADEFYWQDYLGKDYAVTAFNLARKHGNETDILFINDYGLEYNLDKCKGLIEYVKYIESKGARVDGIGTQMHVSVSDANRETITEMFKLLAATGKKIKISELDLGLGDGKTTEEATEEDYIAQSDLYEFIVSEYFKIIPPAQRYGITMWSPLDSPKTSSWRKGEPIGLWTESYTRKHAYAGFANGLAGRDISSDLD